MRILIVVLVLIFSFQSQSISEEFVIDNLFGIKILDNINKYANRSDGVKYDHLPNIITFENEALNIERDDNFENYYVRTDNDYKIQNITSMKYFVSSINNFDNNCKIEKSNMVLMFSKFFDIKKNKFKNYYWIDPRDKSIYDDSSLTYQHEGNDFQLSTYCGYYGAGNDIISILFVSWVTDKYFKKHVDGRWSEIKKFDEKFIKTYFSSSS